MIKKLKFQKGFTVIEILVVLVVLLVVGSIIVTIFTSSLRGTNKVNSIDSVRRNGNYALEQMGKMIRYARSFDGVSANGTSWSTNCVAPSIPAPTPTPTPVTYNFIRITNFDGGQSIISCIKNGSSLGASEIASTSASSTKVHLVDTNVVTVNNCTIMCQQNTIVSPPTVLIQFDLANKTTNSLLENQATISFQTSVTARNY